jgi:DNA-binding transcriptional LysR family regulator
MPRFDINRSAEMEVFARVVDLCGFSAAARDLRMTPSGVSKLVSRLETRLSTRLFNRSTRRLQLTPEGEAFYVRTKRLLADMEEAERRAAAGASPRGHLSVNCNLPYGNLHVLPLISAFLDRYPEVTLDLILTDTVVDLMEERADVAIRVGTLVDSGLIARKLSEHRKRIVASPEYLARRGVPTDPAALTAHRSIGWTFFRPVTAWPFLVNGEQTEIMPPPVARVSDGEAARQLALRGVGLARLSDFQVETDIAAGRLISVLDAYSPGDLESVHAVYLRQGGPLPARVRAFIDMLAANIGGSMSKNRLEHKGNDC